MFPANFFAYGLTCDEVHHAFEGEPPAIRWWCKACARAWKVIGDGAN